MEQEFVQNNFHDHHKIHPDWQPKKELIALFEDKKQEALIKLRKRFHCAALFQTAIKEQWKGSLFLSYTKYHDIIFQSKHSQQRLSDDIIAKRINIDGTWTKIHGTKGYMYNQIIFFHVLVESPTIERTAKLIFIAAAVTKGKNSDRYAAIAQQIKKHNPNIDNIQQLSSDFEIGLYSQFKNHSFTKAKVILCFFHMMQSFFRRVQVFSLYNFKNPSIQYHHFLFRN